MWWIWLWHWHHQQWWVQCTPKRIVDVVYGFLHLWFPGILQNFALYFDGSKQDYVCKYEDVPEKLLAIILLSNTGKINHMIRQVGATDPVFPQSYRTILNKQEFSIYNSVTWLVQHSLYTVPTMSSIYDKSGAGWDGINTDNYFKNYFKTSNMGDVVQKVKSLQHHNSLKRTTFNWWQWGILKLSEQIQMKGHFYSMCDGSIWREQCHHLSKASKTIQKWYLHIWCK